MSTESAPPILPDVDDPVTAPFWAGAREGKLLVQTCGACGKPRFPPRLFCAGCASTQVEWRESRGRGRIWSWVLAHGPTLPAFSAYTPYPVIVVQLDDFPAVRLVGNLVATPDAAINSVLADSIAIDMPVTVCFRALDERVTLPFWTPGS